MSTQRTKTKRLGSHRRVTKQNETPKADELHVMDSTSVAQSHIAEKNSESLSVLFNCDSLQLEGPHPPSPDLIVNRKKLGSRRKKKEQLVKDSATESHHEPREEVEENTKGNETQSERQEELSKGTGQDVTATHDSSVHSVITPGYSCEAKRPTTTSSEDVLENIIPQDQNTDQNVNEKDCEVKSDCCKLEETMLEVTDKSGIVQSKEVKTSAHLVGSSDYSSSVLLSLTINQQLMDQSDYREVLKEPVSGYSATEENESFETTEMSLLTDTTVQVTSVTGMDKSESHQTEELGQIEEIAHHENISELHGSPLHPALSDGQQLINQTNIKVRKEREDNRDFLRQWEMLQANSSVNESSVVSDDVSVNQPTEIQEIHLTDDHSQSEINDATEIQFANLADQTELCDAELYHKPKQEGAEDITGNDPLQKMALTLQTTNQEEESQESELTSDFFSEVQNPSTTTSLEADLKGLIHKRGDPEESNDEKQAAFKVEMCDGAMESDTLESEKITDTHSEVPVDEVHEQEVKPTEIQTMHESDYSFKNATHDTAEKSDTCSENLKDQDEVSGTHQPELLVENIDDPAPKEEVSDPGDKQNKHPTKERNAVDSDQINEDDLVFDMKKQQTNDIERADIAPGQGHEGDGRVEDDVKPSAEQTSHWEKEGLGSEVEESETSLQTQQSGSNAPSDSQPQDNSVEADDKSDTDVKPIGNRRKMGSSRRNKGRQPGKISGADAYSRPAEEDAGDVHDLEDLQTTSLAVQTISQDNSENGIIMSVSHDRSLNTESLSDYSSEVQNSSTTTSLEAEMESFIPKGRDPEESHDEREAAFKVEMSDEAVEGELEERMGKSDTLQYLSDTHSEVPVDEVHEQEVKPTEIQTMHESDYSFENAMHDTAEKSDTCSGNLKDQDEVVQTEEVTDQIKEIAHVGISELTHPNLCTSSTVDQQVIDQSNARDMPADNLPSVSPLTDRTINKESEKDTDLLRQWGILQAIKMVSESNLKSDGIDSSDTTEKTAENSSPRQHIEAEFSVEQATVSSAKEELSTNEEQNERFSLSEVRFDQPSEDAVHEEEEANLPEIKTMHQFDDSPAKSQSTNEETPQGFKSTGNRRKLGSSRRHKGRQHVPGSVTEPSTRLKEAVENTWDDELCEVEKIPPGTVTTRQEERKEEENMQGEDTTSQNLMDSNATVTTGIPSRLDENIFFKSTEEVSQEEEKHTKKPEDLSLLTIYDTVKTDLIQSEEASAGRSVDAQGPGQVEIREECEDTANTESRAPFDIEQHLRANPAVEMSEVSGISKATDTWNSQQDKQEGTPVDNSENLQVKGQRKKRKMGSTRRPLLDRKQDGEIDNKVETIESNSDVEVDVRSLDTVEGLPLIGTTEASQWVNAQRLLRTGHEEQKTNETASQRQMPQSSTSDLQTVESNMKPGIDESMVLFSKQSASYNEEAVNPVALVHATDIRDHEGNIEVSVEPQQLDDFTSTEMQTNSVVTKRNRHSINQHLSSNTQDATSTESGVAFSSSETAQSKLHNKQSPESIKVKQDQALKPTEAVSVGLADLEKAKSGFREGAEEELAQASEQEPSNGNTEDQNFGVTSRRRKLGSTRKNLGSRSNGRDLHQKQEVTNEATAIIVEDALTEGISRIKEKVVQVHTDSEQRKDRVLEAVECSHTGKSLLKPMAHETVEEKPDSPIQLGETELQITPDYLQSTPSTFQKHDVSESAGGGKRRKMGSHRKSRGHQHLEDQSVREDRTIDAETVRDVTSVMAEEHTTPWGMDKILEVGDGRQEASSNISGRASNRVNPFQCPQAEFQFGQQSQKKVSFAEADIRSKSYNVLMVGESSVGKTSFMKRAQSGKFSLDLPASVGLDSCMWTVVVDGKPVVLKIWDTAGQERFHSITRQIFHKAQAFLLMYDITSTQSFSAISYWANSIQEGAAEDVSILLLGNKCDCAKRKVKTQEGEILAKEYNYEFMECSAATGENVIQSLETVARMLSQKVDTTEEELVLHKEPPQKKRSGCC